jgi:hypothetical protein
VSETASTIVKLLSTLTSPKACVKYIAVAVFIVLSWQYLNDLLLKFGVPEEHINIVVLLLGVGIGALIGHVLSFVGASLWNSIQNKREYRRAEKAKALALAVKKTKDEAENRILIERYERSFTHFHWDQKETLRNQLI